MATNNISQKHILSYWGIDFISEQVLKSSKKNKPQAVKPMQRLLFNLVVLHMFDYKIRLKDYFSGGKLFEVSQQEIEQIILAYLSQCQCPFLLELANQKQQDETKKAQYFVGCDLQSSNTLLILCGWVMAVSDYFSRILSQVILNVLDKIQNPQNTFKSAQIQFEEKKQLLQSQEGNQTSESLLRLYRRIQAHRYQVDCYKQKKLKIRRNIQKKMQNYLNLQIKVDEIFAFSQFAQHQNRNKLERQLNRILTNEIQNMKQRKYFWIWLEEKTLKQYEADLKKQNHHFEALQYQDHKICHSIKVQLEYLNKYIELCSYYEKKYSDLESKLDQMKPTIKKYKEIETEVRHQFKQTLQSSQIQNNKKHLFVALQLKNHLNYHSNKNKESTKEQQEYAGNAEKAIGSQRKKLKKQLKTYLNSIKDAIAFD